MLIELPVILGDVETVMLIQKDKIENIVPNGNHSTLLFYGPEKIKYIVSANYGLVRKQISGKKWFSKRSVGVRP